MQRRDPETSTTLLGRLRNANDDEAWNEFEQRYGPMLLRFCRSLGLQHADAEDAVQSVIAKLVTGLRTFQYDRQRGRFRDYLFRCARSAFFDLKRRQKRSGSSVVHSNGSSPEVHEDVLRSSFEREWIDHHYRLAIAHLRMTTEPQTMAVLEASLRSEPVRHIARRMQMTEDAVYKCLQRVRQRLREQIARQIEQEEGDP